ncbi:unnamed protein product [Natator depressus]
MDFSCSRGKLQQQLLMVETTSLGLKHHHIQSAQGPHGQALTRRLDFTWGNILCLGLVSGVLLALVLIMAEAGYCWKETPGGSLDPAMQR